MTEQQGIESLSIAALFALQKLTETKAVEVKAQAAEVAAEISRRFADSAKQSLTQAGKEHGTITLPLQDGFIVKGKVDKKVEWDSAKLQAVAQTLPWERVAAMFKIEFSMPEAIYKGIAAFSPEMRAQIDAARTTTYSEPKLALSKEG